MKLCPPPAKPHPCKSWSRPRDVSHFHRFSAPTSSSRPSPSSNLPFILSRFKRNSVLRFSTRSPFPFSPITSNSIPQKHLEQVFPHHRRHQVANQLWSTCCTLPGSLRVSFGSSHVFARIVEYEHFDYALFASFILLSFPPTAGGIGIATYATEHRLTKHAQRANVASLLASKSIPHSAAPSATAIHQGSHELQPRSCVA